MATAARQATDKDIKDLRALSGGSEPLMRAMLRGGFGSFEEALAAVKFEVERYSNEGPLRSETTVMIRRGRYAWMVHEDECGRWQVCVSRRPTQEPTTVRDRARVRAWMLDARAALKPIRNHLRKRDFRDPTAHLPELRALYPKEMRRIEAAGLLRSVIVRRHLIRPIEDDASDLVSAEHPEAGAPKTVLGKSKRKPEAGAPAMALGKSKRK